MNKKNLIIGGLAVAGIVVLYMILKKGNQDQALPIPTQAPPLNIPAYPPAATLPAFQVNASPQYITFNAPADRNLVPPSDSSKNLNSCGCGDTCDQSVTSSPTFSQSFKNASARNVASKFSLGPNPSNMVMQFPPSLYPWLYGRN